MLLNMDRDRNIDFFGKKVSIFCRTHNAVGHRIQGGRPGPLRLPSAAVGAEPMYSLSPCQTAEPLHNPIGTGKKNLRES